MSDAEKSVSTSPSAAKPKKRSWRWRFFRFVVVSFAALVTLFILFHAVENWRGKRAWEQYRKEQEAKGVSFDFNSIVPRDQRRRWYGVNRACTSDRSTSAAMRLR